MITICLTYYRSLTLANLAAALFSVRQQNFLGVEEIVLVDNDTADPAWAIQQVVDDLRFPVPVRVLSEKHGCATRTHAWSTNVAVRAAQTEWIFFTRADYLLDFSILRRFVEVMCNHAPDWDGFLVSNGCHLHLTVEDCEQTNWRHAGPGIFQGATFDYTLIDAGVWMATKATVDAVGGMDESLSAWGHAQTYFQHKIWQRHQTQFVRLPHPLFFHPAHGGARDLTLANEQLGTIGADLKAMWARYEGRSPY